jgi:hypothetical protein
MIGVILSTSMAVRFTFQVHRFRTSIFSIQQMMVKDLIELAISWEMLLEIPTSLTIFKLSLFHSRCLHLLLLLLPHFTSHLQCTQMLALMGWLVETSDLVLVQPAQVRGLVWVLELVQPAKIRVSERVLVPVQPAKVRVSVWVLVLVQPAEIKDSIEALVLVQPAEASNQGILHKGWG